MSKIAITPIGTCRIHTPLRRGAARYPVDLRTNRNYGFTHTSEEALQQLRYMQREQTFENDIFPLLFRQGFNERAEGDWQPADLHVVEISSAKYIRIGEASIQSNYFARHFADFFASGARARMFWNIARTNDAAAMRAFLEKEPVYRLLGEADRELLARVTMQLQTLDDLVRDLGEMVERLGRDRFLLVSHVNAETPGGTLIASRDRLIRWTHQAAERLGVPCLDPTPMMREFGQARTMENGGLDTTHFTNEFADKWYGTIHAHHVLPRILNLGLEDTVSEAASSAMLSESIEVLIEQDDFLEGSRRLFAALKHHPADSGLVQLRGQVHARIGDFASAIGDLEAVEREGKLTASGMTRLMEAYYHEGRDEEALAAAERLLQDEYENRVIFDIAGRAASRLGREDDAARLFLLAFRHDNSQHSCAIRVLDHFLKTGEADKLALWRGELRDRLAEGRDAGLARAVFQWALANRADDLIGEALLGVARVDMDASEHMLEEVQAADLIDPAADAIVAINAMPNLTSRVLRAARAIAVRWADAAAVLQEQGHGNKALALASAALKVLPSSAVARRVAKEVMLELRTTVRAAQLRQDYAEVVALAEPAGPLIYGRPDTAIAYAQALLALERGEEAFDVSQRALKALPDNIDVQALAANIAAGQGRFGVALRLFGPLSQSQHERVERHRRRIDRFMATVPRLGIRNVRELSKDGDYAEALDLSKLIMDYAPETSDLIEREMNRIRSALRGRLNRLAEEEGEEGEALRTLQLMLRVVPEDPSMLRRAAQEAMKLQNFAQARAYWLDLDRVSPGLDSTARCLRQCQIYLDRQTRTQPEPRLAMA